MKQIFVVVLLLFTSVNCLAQAPIIQWQKSLGGSNLDEAYSMQHTTDGGYIIAGGSNSNDGDVSGNHGSGDFWIVKINDTGAIQWQKSLGGSAGEGANSIQQTRDGGYIVAGSSNSNDGDVSGHHGVGPDYWIVKINDTGGIQWQKSLGGSDFDEAWSIEQTTDGGYIVAGWSGSNDGDVTGNHGDYDYWIVKLNDTGGIQWQKSLGGSSFDEAQSIHQTIDGGYIVAGASSSNDGDITGNHGSWDYWIVKLNDTGAIQWQKSMGGSDEDNAWSMLQTIDGGYVIAGQSASNDGDVTGNHGNYDYWIVKINDTGTIQWQRSLGGDTDDLARAIQQTADGGYVVAGYSNSNDGDVTGNHGHYDYWIVKLNDTGAIQWQRSLGGDTTDFALAILQTTDGGYMVGGYSVSNDDDVSGNHGSNDYWIVKLTCGLLAGSISGPISVCLDSAITLTDTAAGGTWSVSNSYAAIADSLVRGIAPGTDTVIYTITNTCGTANTSFPFNVIRCPEGVNQVSSATNVSIAPNPTTGDIFVTGVSDVTIKVYNILGQLLKEAINTNQMSISEFPSALYFVRVYNAQGTLIKQDKVVKE